MSGRPQGERAMSGAERQARYRLRHGLAGPRADAAAPVAESRVAREPRPPSRARRWHDAVAGLVALQNEYARWLDALPQALRETPTGEALQAIAELDLDEVIAIRPPLGFGRD